MALTNTLCWSSHSAGGGQVPCSAAIPPEGSGASLHIRDVVGCEAIVALQRIVALASEKRVQPSVPLVLRAYRDPTEQQLVSRAVEQDGFHGTSQEQDVQPYRPVPHVVSVHPNPLAEEGVVAPENLSWAGHSRGNTQYLALSYPDLFALAGQVGSGTDQAHFPFQDVPELRQLV